MVVAQPAFDEDSTYHRLVYAGLGSLTPSYGSQEGGEFYDPLPCRIRFTDDAKANDGPDCIVRSSPIQGKPTQSCANATLLFPRFLIKPMQILECSLNTSHYRGLRVLTISALPTSHSMTLTN